MSFSLLSDFSIFIFSFDIIFSHFYQFSFLFSSLIRFSLLSFSSAIVMTFSFHSFFSSLFYFEDITFSGLYFFSSHIHCSHRAEPWHLIIDAISGFRDFHCFQLRHYFRHYFSSISIASFSDISAPQMIAIDYFH